MNKYAIGFLRFLATVLLIAAIEAFCYRQLSKAFIQLVSSSSNYEIPLIELRLLIWGMLMTITPHNIIKAVWPLKESNQS